MVGYTNSPDFPPSGIDTASQIFVSSLDAGGSQLRYSVTVASATANDGHAIALGPGDDVFFTGSQNAPSDLYAARLSESSGPGPTPTPAGTPIPPTPTPPLPAAASYT